MAGVERAELGGSSSRLLVPQTTDGFGPAAEEGRADAQG
jgi:hypothetical protein